MGLKKESFKELKTILTASGLPSYQEIFDIADEVTDILMSEKTEYRPVASDGEVGGLLDFKDVTEPLVVVPDLHARPYFLLNILSYKMESGKTIFEALEDKDIFLVFVGDILHTERNTRDRWTAAALEFAENIYTGPAISAEMKEGLSLLCGLMKLKIMFPHNCHILKGNHENIYNYTGDGDFGFRKFADEGNMCRLFIQDYYGDDILYMIHCFEKNLPLLFLGNKCLISHAEPKIPYSRKELIDARMLGSVVEGLTWTENDAAQEGSVEATIKNLTGLEDCGDYVYLGGHRPVNGNYKLRQNGLYIQFHNPGRQNVAIVKSDKKFNPNLDIVEVAK